MLDSIQQKTMPNGLKVICLRKPGTPVASVQVWYRSGSACERDGMRGISHMLEHMMFRGSANVGSEEHANRINEVGGHCNAFTAEDVTAYTNSVPVEQLRMVLDLEADRMVGLTLDRDMLETERNVLVEEYHTYMNNPVAKAFLQFRRSFFGSHPYAIGPLGEIDDMKAIVRDALVEHYERWYTPGNAVLVVVGDIDSEDALFDKVADSFGSIPCAAAPDRWPEPGNAEYDVTHREPFMKRRVEFDVPILMAGYPAPPSSSDDALALEVLHMVVSQGETSRLHREMVRHRSVAVMAGGLNHLLKHAGMTLFFAAFTPDMSYRRVDRALCAEIERTRNEGISEWEMEKIRNTTLTQRTFEMFSVEHICQRIGYADCVDGDYRIWLRRLEQLERLERDQLVSVARKYWDSRFRQTLYLRPRRVSPMLLLSGLVRRLVPAK